jgi:hypothetical protein
MPDHKAETDSAAVQINNAGNWFVVLFHRYGRSDVDLYQHARPCKLTDR